VKGHKLHVRRKMEENNGKMKKIEASLIKRLVRIISWLFIGSVLKLSFYSVSLSYSLTLRVFLEHSGRSVALCIWIKKETKE